MVEQEVLIRAGIYLAKLNPAKAAEVGKVRPVIILNAQTILDVIPPTVFICPLSSQSHEEFSGLHVALAARDNLNIKSYALVEHCRSITVKRIIYPRLGQLTPLELKTILHRLQRLVGL